MTLDAGIFGDIFSSSSSTTTTDSEIPMPTQAKAESYQEDRQSRRRRRREQRRQMKEQQQKIESTPSLPTPPPPPPSSQFDMAQRFESIKTAVLGALSGGIAVTPVTFLHCVLGGAGGLAQWEFATDMSSLEAALFAIVYRYAARANDNNPMLNRGVVGAFVVVRTLSNIQVTPTCSAVPLQCK